MNRIFIKHDSVHSSDILFFLSFCRLLQSFSSCKEPYSES
jgi:hypothetical protein